MALRTAFATASEATLTVRSRVAVVFPAELKSTAPMMPPASPMAAASFPYAPVSEGISSRMMSV